MTNTTLRDLLELRLLRIAALELLREKWAREWEQKPKGTSQWDER